MIVLACDLGGTRLKIGLVRNGRVLSHTDIQARSDQGLAPQLHRLKATWMDLLEKAHLRLAECAGLSICVPSLVDPGTGRVLAQYGKFADAPNLDLRAWAKAEFNLPAAIENDARMALIGEWQAGAGQGINNLAMIGLGTGLGTSAIIEGRVLRGIHGQAGVLGGHSTVRYSGRPCTCGNIGCAEAEASTAFLNKIASEMPGFNESGLQEAGPLNFGLIFAKAAEGNTFATALRDHSLRVWGTLAVNLIHAYDPEVVILGGGVMGSADVILPSVRDYVARYAHTPWGKVRVVPSELGDKAALIAAEWLLQEQGF